MANQAKNPPGAAPQKGDKQRDEGVGQSGYAAGRGGADSDDAALDKKIETRNPGYPSQRDAGEALAEPHTDERFTGRGGKQRSDPGVANNLDDKFDSTHEPAANDANNDATVDEVINDDAATGPARGAD